ncbi:MAG: hypothetical protein FK733_00030 [Asgard group archaeon]|nr:hypothetical protein [Asgard group archaeon]
MLSDMENNDKAKTRRNPHYLIVAFIFLIIGLLLLFLGLYQEYYGSWWYGIGFTVVIISSAPLLFSLILFLLYSFPNLSN